MLAEPPPRLALRMYSPHDCGVSSAAMFAAVEFAVIGAAFARSIGLNCPSADWDITKHNAAIEPAQTAFIPPPPLVKSNDYREIARSMSLRCLSALGALNCSR